VLTAYFCGSQNKNGRDKQIQFITEVTPYFFAAECVHAVAREVNGSTWIVDVADEVAQELYDAMNLKDTPESLRARYYAAIERLTAAVWRDMGDGWQSNR
jgi:hypothetical protein